MSSPTLPRSLERSFSAAVESARAHRHEYVTLEHLLWALALEPRCREVLEACGADVAIMRRELEEYLHGVLEPLPEGAAGLPEQTLSVRRVLAAVVYRAQSAERDAIDPASILVEIFDEPDSHARYVLEHQDISRLDILNYVAHGITKESYQPVEDDEDERDPARDRDPLKAFTTELVERAAHPFPDGGEVEPAFRRAVGERELAGLVAGRPQLEKLPIDIVGVAGEVHLNIRHGLAGVVADRGF